MFDVGLAGEHLDRLFVWLSLVVSYFMLSFFPRESWVGSGAWFGRFLRICHTYFHIHKMAAMPLYSKIFAKPLLREPVGRLPRTFTSCINSVH